MSGMAMRNCPSSEFIATNVRRAIGAAKMAGAKGNCGLDHEAMMARQLFLHLVLL
jgi:hypothetical protein